MCATASSRNNLAEKEVQMLEDDHIAKAGWLVNGHINSSLLLGGTTTSLPKDVINREKERHY